MRAIGARDYFPVDTEGCLEEFSIPIPSPEPRDLLIKVKAIAINPVDAKIRKSLKGKNLVAPRILGVDAAGVVQAIGSEVTGFQAGDEVFYAGDVTRSGSNAEFQIVDERLVAKKPTGWSFSDSAALPLVAITAWELLFERMGVDSNGSDQGKAILIINGAGGVGSALIPLARKAGLTVVATASRPVTQDWCISLGAHHVINHHTALLPQAEAIGFRDFPLIANLSDTENYWETTSEMLAPLGTLGLIVETSRPMDIGNPFRLKSPRIVWEYMPARSMHRTQDMGRQGEILREIAQRCDAATFPNIVTRTFDRITVENLLEGHRAMESGTAHGKWTFAGW